VTTTAIPAAGPPGAAASAAGAAAPSTAAPSTTTPSTTTAASSTAAVLHSVSSLRAAGYTYDDVRHLLRGGALTPVRRGTYVAGTWPDDRHASHRLAVRAAAGDLGADAVVSHASAAVLHGLPTWCTPLDRVHVTKNRSSGGRRSRRVHLHVAALPPGEIVELAGVRVTSLLRTLADVTRSVPFEQGVVVLDAALAGGLVDPEELPDALHRMRRRRGVSLARRVAAFADGRSESVGESRSRVAIARVGLPPPTLQWQVRDAAGRLVGRVDFGWPEEGVVGEFDGRLKYGGVGYGRARYRQAGYEAGGPAGAERDAVEAVYREKRREDELRAQRLTVVRWSWADLERFEPVATRLARAIRDG
jgi:predicted transcriptional regulator of viral defense system